MGKKHVPQAIQRDRGKQKDGQFRLFGANNGAKPETQYINIQKMESPIRGYPQLTPSVIDPSFGTA